MSKPRATQVSYDKTLMGLNNVDNTRDVDKPVSSAHLAGLRARGSTIRPDDFTGTDVQRLQAAVNFCIANSYPTIILDRMLDLTGAVPVSVDKVVWSNRQSLTFEGTGGGIIKNDAGAVFTSSVANTGDLTFHKVKYISTAGAGAILFDGDKLLRCFSSGCEYRNWDLVLSQTVVGRWVQSMRFHHEKIVGGAGPAFLFRESYDVSLDDILCEDRSGVGGGLVANSDGTMTGIANRILRISNCCIENCSGIPIKLAMCWPTLIQGNYLEQNGGATDPQIDLYSLATLSAQASVIISSNQVQQKTTQKVNIVGAFLVGPGRTKDVITSIGNISDGGVLYQFAGSGVVNVFGSSDYVEASGLLVYPGQESRYFTAGSRATTTAGRPKSARLDPYFDTDLSKLITLKTAGTKPAFTFRLTAGATTSGNITLSMLSVNYVVAVTAGDTLTQVRDKIVAAAAVFMPNWTPAASSTNLIYFTGVAPGIVAGVSSFTAGSTGVTSDYFGRDVPGVDPTWNEYAAVLATTSVAIDPPSIAAGAEYDFTITVTGANVSDSCVVNTRSMLDTGISISGYAVTATNTITVRLRNNTAAAIDPIARTWDARVIR